MPNSSGLSLNYNMTKGLSLNYTDLQGLGAVWLGDGGGGETCMTKGLSLCYKTMWKKIGLSAEFRQLANHLDFRLIMTNATSTANPCREKTLTKGLSLNYESMSREDSDKRPVP